MCSSRLGYPDEFKNSMVIRIKGCNDSDFHPTKPKMKTVVPYASPGFQLILIARTAY